MCEHRRRHFYRPYLTLPAPDYQVQVVGVTHGGREAYRGLIIFPTNSPLISCRTQMVLNLKHTRVL